MLDRLQEDIDNIVNYLNNEKNVSVEDIQCSVDDLQQLIDIVTKPKCEDCEPKTLEEAIIKMRFTIEEANRCNNAYNKISQQLEDCRTELCTLCERKKRFEQGWCKECIWNEA